MTSPALRRPVVILGAGGHARVVLDALRSRGEREVVAALEADPARHGGDLDGVPIVGGDDRLDDYPARDFAVAVAVVGFGAKVVRHALAQLLRSKGYELVTVVHASAVVSPRASLAPGAQVMAGAVVNPGATLAADAIVNTGAVVEHDCVVGRGAHLGPRAVLGGGVLIGPEAQLGLGAIVLPHLRVGTRAVVGAGAVVLRDVADDAVVVGAPARAMAKGPA